LGGGHRSWREKNLCSSSLKYAIIDGGKGGGTEYSEGVLFREKVKELNGVGVHNWVPFTSAVTGSTIVGASARDDRDRGETQGDMR